MEIRSDRRYSTQHEWVQVQGDSAIVGITDFAQDSLGDIVFIDLPDKGADVIAGASVCEVESTKSVSDIFAPLTGVIAEANSELGDNPELINTSPYDEGWILKLCPFDAAGLEDLLGEPAYRELTE